MNFKDKNGQKLKQLVIAWRYWVWVYDTACL